MVAVHGNGDIEQRHPIINAFQFVLPVNEHGPTFFDLPTGFR
jgi:hypothetical protein